MSAIAEPASPGYTGRMHPLLNAVHETKLRADDLRAELRAAEQAHHDAVLAAASAVGEDDEDGLGEARFSVHEIAAAAGCSRGRIYKRLAKPTYGDRSTARAAYQ